jgi:hypothetical protein
MRDRSLKVSGGRCEKPLYERKRLGNRYRFLGLWLEKTVKKLLFWSEIEEGDENDKVLGSVRDEKVLAISLLVGPIGSWEEYIAPLGYAFGCKKDPERFALSFY